MRVKGVWIKVCRCGKWDVMSGKKEERLRIMGKGEVRGGKRVRVKDGEKGKRWGKRGKG
jgi:hypothetical protein